MNCTLRGPECWLEGNCETDPFDRDKGSLTWVNQMTKKVVVAGQKESRQPVIQ